ncbi:ankyrin [Wilcoxina mikolae CBS 423.85]|nr:ankyrin [Wilcoxina mikolae CBS 423.85]
MLSTLPAELTGLIADGLDACKDLNALLRTDHYHYHFLNPRLYKLGAQFDNSISLLCWAIKNNKTPTFLRFLYLGVDISPRLLYDAASYGRDSMIRALLEKDADLIKSTYMGYPPLHAAIMGIQIPSAYSSYYFLSYKTCGCVERTLRLLLEKGAEVEARDVYGITALILLAQQRDPDHNLVRLLLENGAEVEAKDPAGRTAFIMLALQHSPDYRLLRLLLENGAEVDAKDPAGRTALILLAQQRNPDHDLLRLLLENGAEVEAKDPTGKTALMLLVRQRSPDFNSLRLLLDHGANVNANYDEDITVLHEAARVGNLDVIKMLVKRGANVNIVDGSLFHWWWATHWATFKNGSGVQDMKEVFALLKSIEGENESVLN